MARSMLRQAASRLKTAETAISDGNYPYSIRSSQECVELSLKASLRLLGIEYPKKHDVSRAMLRFRERYPGWFPVERFAKTSTRLAKLREPAMYGEEESLTPPEALFTEEEARKALEEAKEVYRYVERMVKEVEGR